MNKIRNEYKTKLLIDLIYYLMGILLKNEPNKLELITYIVDKWEEKRKKELQEILKNQVRKHCKETGESEDVMTILVSAETEDNIQTIDEVAYQVKQVVVKTLINKR